MVSVDLEVTVKLYGLAVTRAVYRVAGWLLPHWPEGACALVNFANHWLLWARIGPHGGLTRIGTDMHMTYTPSERRW